MKRCNRCGETKEFPEFYHNKRLDRFSAYCRPCERDMKREAARRQRAEDPEKAKATAKAAQDRYRAKYPGLAAKRTARWREANRDWALQAQRDADRKNKVAAYEAYGGFRCACCGESIEAFLSLDHVNNDGAEHRKTVDRRKLYKWLKSNGYPPGFQVLCMNCNFGKARNGGICPHKTSEGSTTIP